MKHGMTCKCPHHACMSVLVLVFGLLFLLGALDVFTDRVVSIVWPILVIVAGFMKLGEGKCKCC